MATEEPWLLMKEVYRDVTFIVAGRRLSYHKAVLNQHSRLIRSLLQDDGWCKCYDVVLSLDDVSLEDVKFVMDLIYNGAGGLSSQNHEAIKAVISMLQIETIVVDDLQVDEGLVVETPGATEFGVVEPGQVIVTRSVSSNVVEQSVKSNTVDPEETPKAVSASDKRKPAEVESTAITTKRRGRKRKQEEVTTPKISKIVTVDTSKSMINPETKKSSNPSSEADLVPKVGLDTDVKVPKIVSTASVKPSKSVDIPEITLDDDEKRSGEKYLCPYSDCQSESKNAQSIKVHLALVHYKKTIQAEFPNWKTQKCESCDKIFGQMTAYYLHMANHKKYKFMEFSPEDFKASKASKNILNSPRTFTGTSTKVEKTLILKTGTPPVVPSRSRTTTLTPVNKIIKPSFSPAVRGPIRSNSFTQEVLKNSGFNAVPRSASFVQSKTKFQQVVRTTPVRSPSVVSKTPTTPSMKGTTGPPGPTSFSAGTVGGLRVSTPVLARKPGTSQPSKDVKQQRGA